MIRLPAKTAHPSRLQRHGQAAEKQNDNFIRPRPPHKAMSDNRANSVKPAPLPQFG